MREKIANKLRDLSSRKALVPFLTCGFPNMSSFENLALSACRSGADILEVGFPFSDPLADGPAIQYSSATALRNGFTVKKGFNTISEISRQISRPMPIVIMTYQNIVHAAGEEIFLKMCLHSGVSGLIIPDLPIDLADSFRRLCRKFDIDLILLASPTTSQERLTMIMRASSGFLYLVSLRGTTGSRQRFPKGTIEYIRDVKSISPLPVLVGFGISGPALAKQAARHSDGVIIGSALVEIIRKSIRIERARQNLERFLISIKKEINT